MREYNWGIIGPGSIAKRFAEGLKHAPGARLYAVGSRSIDRAEAFRSEYGFEKAYGSYGELVNDKHVDIVYIATPHPQHAEAATLCMGGGKAVLCEKPFAVNKKQAAAMIECAKKNNVFCMEAMWTRFFPAVKKTRELISAGAIGAVRHISADFGFRTAINLESRLFDPECAGGSLLDVGCYNVSFCSMIYGKQPDHIHSLMDIGASGADEITNVLLGYAGGQSAFCLSAIRLSTAQEATIYGEEGYIKLPGYWHGDKVILSGKDGVQTFELPFESTGFQFEASEVMACLEQGLKESPLMPLHETLAIAGTLDNIRAQHGLRYPFE